MGSDPPAPVRWSVPGLTPYDRVVRSFAAAVMCALVAVATATAVEQTDARARDAYTRALELEERGNNAAALPLLWEAAGLAPRDADIQNRLGEALERIGALDAAIDAYRAALAQRPSYTKASNNLILTLVKAGKAGDAIARARALISEAPDDAERVFTLGLAQSEADVPGAIATFRRTLQMAPGHALARYNLALVLQRADRIPEAVTELKRTLDAEPRPEAHYALGVIYWHEGDFQEAISELRAAIGAQPAYADAHLALGAVLKAKRDYPAAAAALRRAVSLRPDLPAGHYTLAQVLQLQGDRAGAHTQREEAERLRRQAERSQEAGVWTAVGSQKLAARDLGGAADCFRRAVEVFPPYAPAHYQLGLVLLSMGKRDAARASFAKANELNPALVPPPDFR